MIDPVLDTRPRRFPLPDTHELSEPFLRNGIPTRIAAPKGSPAIAAANAQAEAERRHRERFRQAQEDEARLADLRIRIGLSDK